jgi:muconolactone delta-isomerase
MSIPNFAYLKEHNNQYKKEEINHRKRRKKIWKEAGNQKYRPYSIMNIDLDREFKDLDQNTREQVKSYYQTARKYKDLYLK